MTGIILWAQGPHNTKNYYQETNGKSGKALKTAFHNVIFKSAHVDSYNLIWEIYKTADKRPDGTVYDIYSNITHYIVGGDYQGGKVKQEGNGYNREHTVPKSWFHKAEPMVNDAFHILPSDSYINTRRSTYPYGETKGDKYKSANEYSKLGTCTTAGYSGTVFEPNNEYKGDLARIYFYMATCYEHNIDTWDSPVMAHDAYRPFVDWQMKMLLRWAKQDPVSQREVDRNEAVAKIQGNRNPFVDYPGLEDYIWGDSVQVPFSYDHYLHGGKTIDPSPEPEPEIKPAPPAKDGIILNEPFNKGKGKFTTENKKLPKGRRYIWSKFGKEDATCIKATAYIKKKNNAAESWLISPMMDLTPYADVQLNFKQTTNYLKEHKDKANELMSVKVCENGSNQWENLPVTIPTNENWHFVSTSVSLKQYTGKNIKIAFVYKSTTACAPTWEIKDLQVVGQAKTNNIITIGAKNNCLDTSKPMYNLQGQRVNAFYRGVVIQNGRKYIIK